MTTDIVTSVCVLASACSLTMCAPHLFCKRREYATPPTYTIEPSARGHTPPPPSAPYLAQASPTERVQLPVARCQLAHAVGEVDAVRLLDQR